MATNIKFHRITATSGSNIKTDQDYVKGDVYFIKSATGNTGKVYICTVAGKGTAATLEDYSVDTNTWRPVVNNLTSTSTDSSLSAAMGKSLSDSITSLNSSTVKKDGTGASGTWGINITGNAASATNADKLGNIVADNYFKQGDAVFNSEWGGKCLWTLWDNHLYAADKRFAITLTGTGATNLSYLFDGSFESSVTITEDQAVLHIKHPTTGNVWTDGLPYGNFYVVFYNSDAENVTGRVYCNYDGQGIGWHDLTATHVRPHVWELNNGYYQLSDLEITITKPASSASIQLCQVLHEVTRSTGPDHAAVMSKYCKQKTNYDIEAAGFIKTGGTSSQFLKADGTVDSNTYSKSNHTHTFASLTSKPTTLAGYGITETDGYLNKISKSGNTLTITPKDGAAFTFTNTTYSRKWDDNLSNTDYPGYGDAVGDALDTSFSLVNVGDMKRWNKTSYMLEGLETLLASI